MNNNVVVDGSSSRLPQGSLAVFRSLTCQIFVPNINHSRFCVAPSGVNEVKPGEGLLDELVVGGVEAEEV